MIPLNLKLFICAKTLIEKSAICYNKHLVNKYLMPIPSNLPDSDLHDIVDRIDEVLHEYNYAGAHNLAGILLSRVVLLVQDEPALGKDLVRYVWEKLDQMEQDNPGGDFDF